MSKQPINRHKDIAQVINHGGYAKLQFVSWMSLVSAYQEISSVFKIADVGATILDFLSRDEFQAITQLSILLLAYRSESVSALYSEHLTNHSLIPRIFPQKKPSFFAGLCCSDATTRENRRTIKAKDSIDDSALFTPDGKWFLTGGRRCATKLYHVTTGRCVKKFEKYNGGIRGVAVDIDGTVMMLAEKLLTTEKPYRLDLVNCRTEKHDKIFEYGRYERPDLIKLTPDGKYILFSIKDSNQIKIWGVDQKQFLDAFTKTLPVASYRLFVCNDDVTRIFLEKHYGDRAIYDCSALPEIKYLDTIRGGHGLYRSNLSPDGKYSLYSEYRGDKIFVIDTKNTLNITEINNANNPLDRTTNQFFVDDGKKIVTINPMGAQRDAALSHPWSMNLIDVNSKKILATRILEKEPRYHAVCKKHFLLAFENHGIQIFSCSALVNDEKLFVTAQPHDYASGSVTPRCP